MIHIQPVVDMLKVHAHHYSSAGDYSTTTLLNPPRYVHLRRRYERDDEKLNYATMMPSFLGTGVHAYVQNCLERSGKNYKLEQTVKATILDRVITGTFDILSDENDMSDIKTCKTWKTVFDPDFKEWHEQQNIYAYLLHLSGIEVRSLNIIAIFMDWVESKTLRDPSYPPAPVMQYGLELWNYEMTADFLNERVQLMKSNEDVPDNELPECTKEERWEHPTKFACMKTPGAAKASRVLDSVDEAVAYMKETKGFGNGSFIEIRPDVRTRCEKYCEVNNVCNVYQNYKMRKDTREVILYEQI